ncbi:MAG: C40 family peptidase [Clostridia bacterium]|nr:C40 family peptidase [Clostridia bacterium]
MKKLIVGMITCAGMLAASTVSFGVTGEVNTDTARIRSEASAESSIVDLLSLNDKVEVVEETGEWYKIKKDDKTGYISKSLLNVSEEVKKESTEEKNEEEKAEETTEENKTEEQPKEEEKKVSITESYTGKLSSEVSLKILPSINSMNIAKIGKDTEIKVTEIINNWCHIETSTYSGWVRIESVEKAVSLEEKAEETAEENKTEEQPKEEKSQNKKGYVNVESVNVRKEKSTDSEKLDSLTKNTEVTILAEEDGWYKIKVKNITGYISKKYISDKKVEEVTSRASDTARQLSESKAAESQEASAPASTGSTGNDVVAFAKQYLGYKYVSGGSSPSTGFDCSGFTSYVYKNFGVSLSRTSSGQRSNGVAVDKSNLQAGDIVCFTGHVGLYIGNNQFIHASNPTGGVKISSLSESYYVKNYITSRRVTE